jgi:hypothetical protein
VVLIVSEEFNFKVELSIDVIFLTYKKCRVGWEG